MRAALGAGDGVDLVDDHRAHGAEHSAAAHGREQDVQRLGRRDEDVRRLAQHPRARRRGSVAGAHGDADLGKALAGAANRRASCASGASRLRCTSLLSALSGETYRMCTALASGSSSPSTMSWFSSQRNAASVLPVPVGARISVSSPDAIAGQPWAAARSARRASR